jgi:uncharacterized membrane protein YgdD (TMEM256/DUF423 family)
MLKNLLIISGISAAIAVVLGAMGAHALKNLISAEQLISFETAVKYQFYHTLALFIIAGLQLKLNSKFLEFASWAFVIGIILFSGSIYLLSTRELFNAPGLTVLGPVTPFGGISFIIGWIFITIEGFNYRDLIIKLHKKDDLR